MTLETGNLLTKKKHVYTYNVVGISGRKAERNRQKLVSCSLCDTRCCWAGCDFLVVSWLDQSCIIWSRLLLLGVEGTLCSSALNDFSIFNSHFITFINLKNSRSFHCKNLSVFRRKIGHFLIIFCEVNSINFYFFYPIFTNCIYILQNFPHLMISQFSLNFL